MAETIQLRRGKSSSWSKKNIILAAGEIGVELNTHQIKVGDGSTAWNELPYIGGTKVVNVQDYTSNPAVVDGVPYQSIDVAFMKAPAGSTIRLNKDFDNSVSIDKK